MMLICHCNIITEKEIEQAIVALLDQDPWQLIVPAKVYHAMQKRGRCCGCFPNVVETIIRVTENYHACSEQSGVDIVSHLDRVRDLRVQYGSRNHERRSTGHRAA
jgi:bacterioferritin-associated ferredoxin